jgi:hypothetical protein
VVGWAITLHPLGQLESDHFLVKRSSHLEPKPIELHFIQWQSFKANTLKPTTSKLAKGIDVYTSQLDMVFHQVFWPCLLTKAKAKAKDIVFRFIIEYNSSLRDFYRPLGNK